MMMTNYQRLKYRINNELDVGDLLLELNGNQDARAWLKERHDEFTCADMMKKLTGKSYMDFELEAIMNS